MKKNKFHILRLLCLSLFLLSLTAFCNNSLSDVHAAANACTIQMIENVDGVTRSADLTIAKGSDRTIVMQKESGYVFLDVKVDDESIGVVSLYTFEAVTADHTLEILLSKKIPAEAVTAVEQKAEETIAAIEKFTTISEENQSAAKAYIEQVIKIAASEINNAMTTDDVETAKTDAFSKLEKQLQYSQEMENTAEIPETLDSQALQSASYAPLQARASAQTYSSITLRWKKVSGATGYYIYGNKANKNNNYKQLCSETAAHTTIYEIDEEVLTYGTYYQFVVLAVDKNNNILATSQMIYAATDGNGYTNAKALTIADETAVKKALKNLKKGTSITLSVSQEKADASLKLKKYRDIQYESSNKKIATVTSKGKIKGIKKGSCYIYVYAQNGLKTKLKVTVK